jgi:putative membrane protein
MTQYTSSAQERKINMSPLNILIGVLVGALFTGFFIWVIARISSLIEVSGFGPAYITAIVIAILNGLVKWLFGSALGGSGTALTGSVLINWIISAIILLLAGRMVKGIRVNGFGSALLAAAVIALFDWLLTWILIGMKF